MNHSQLGASFNTIFALGANNVRVVEWMRGRKPKTKGGGGGGDNGAKRKGAEKKQQQHTPIPPDWFDSREFLRLIFLFLSQSVVEWLTYTQDH